MYKDDKEVYKAKGEDTVAYWLITIIGILGVITPLIVGGLIGLVFAIPIALLTFVMGGIIANHSVKEWEDKNR